jgi:tRNA modification GTPase
LTATIEIDGARFELLDTAGVDSTLPLPGGCRPGEGQVARNAPWRSEGAPGYAVPHPAISQAQSVSDVDLAAQSLAEERRAAAAIRVYCVDHADATPISISDPRVRRNFARCDIVVLTKADLKREPQQPPATPPGVAVVSTSSRTGEGLGELCGHIRALLRSDAIPHQGRSIASTAERCRESIRLAQSAIVRASEIVNQGFGDELAAAELRIALAELGKVVGAVYTDDLLDRVFSTFCIGK